VLVDRIVWPLRKLQTGVAWVAVGTAVIGGVWAIALR
jgi:hypothetical protein